VCLYIYIRITINLRLSSVVVRGFLLCFVYYIRCGMVSSLIFLLWIYVFILCITKKADDCKQGTPWILSCFISLYNIFVLTCLMMAWERVELCSIHVKAQLDFKLTCVVLYGISVVCLVDLRCPQRWKSRGSKWGKWAGHAVGSPRSICCSGKLFKNSQNARRKCGGAQPCMIQN
jgi:hypothetical protein